jgi:DNA invertase Pin-like site-specific DNA recombinase
MQTKIKTHHLALIAYIYIRQSTLEQVFKHKESQQLQYSLVDKAKQMGWASPGIIDEDLGRSGSGTEKRPGFSFLLQQVMANKVGAIFCLEASRLARNNYDWSVLLHYCKLTDTLIIDQDGVYDANIPTDGVFLGMKGTMSQYELGIFRQRAQQARDQKAARGDYYTNLPGGYIMTPDRRCEMDPDQRIQDALLLLFKKFREFGSIPQLVEWFRAKELTIPCRDGGYTTGKIEWRLPKTGLVRKLLLNPIYAGAYAYGRSREDIRVVDGQFLKVSRKNLPIDEWKVLLKDHHQGYISWDEYLENRQRLHQNQSKRGLPMKGAAKRGPALLAGLLRCRKCGQMLYVRYSSSQPDIPRYRCPGRQPAGLTDNCISFAGAALEQVVEEQLLRVVQPAAIAAAQEAERLYLEQQNQQTQSFVYALQQAEYEANRCFEQYNQVDPKNRLVAATLEARWNSALEKVEEKKQRLERVRAAVRPLSPQQKQSLTELANDLPKAWRHAKADNQLKKRILRTVIREIVVDIDDDNNLVAVIHWFGGKHTQHQIRRRRKARVKSDGQPDLLQIIGHLAATSRDQDIARILNLSQIKTESGHTWRANRVQEYRQKHGIAAFDADDYACKGWVNLQQAAEILHVHPETVRRLIKAKLLQATQVIKYSPWIIDKEHLQNQQLKKTAKSVDENPKLLAANNPNQLSID